MRKLWRLLLIWLLPFFLPSLVYAAGGLFGGNPKSVTITVTTITNAYVASSPNSANVYTVLRGSTSFCKGWIITPPTGVDLYVNYSGLTYTATTDTILIRSIDPPKEGIVSIPDGISVCTTYTTRHSGTPAISVYFESQK